MKIEGQQQLLRIFINESDAWEGRPLYKVIIEKLRKAQLAGCTAVRGVEGFGSSHHIHDARFEALFLDLPVIIEVVDTDEKIQTIIPELDKMIKVGLMTLEAVDVEMYGAYAP
jgi:PII-like signaling protein